MPSSLCFLGEVKAGTEAELKGGGAAGPDSAQTDRIVGDEGHPTSRMLSLVTNQFTVKRDGALGAGELKPNAELGEVRPGLQGSCILSE